MNWKSRLSFQNAPKQKKGFGNFTQFLNFLESKRDTKTILGEFVRMMPTISETQFPTIALLSKKAQSLGGPKAAFMLADAWNEFETLHEQGSTENGKENQSQEASH